MVLVSDETYQTWILTAYQPHSDLWARFVAETEPYLRLASFYNSRDQGSDYHSELEIYIYPIVAYVLVYLYCYRETAEINSSIPGGGTK